MLELIKNSFQNNKLNFWIENNDLLKGKFTYLYRKKQRILIFL